mmetsp:Transcript_3043/g.8363  ORF Transcript_3043/g.8363 Transcript_3043/m.8363 type:complete len:270 (+) Transcript_3043:103-912(+)
MARAPRGIDQSTVRLGAEPVRSKGLDKALNSALQLLRRPEKGPRGGRGAQLQLTRGAQAMLLLLLAPPLRALVTEVAVLAGHVSVAAASVKEVARRAETELVADRADGRALRRADGGDRDRLRQPQDLLHAGARRLALQGEPRRRGRRKHVVQAQGVALSARQSLRAQRGQQRRGQGRREEARGNRWRRVRRAAVRACLEDVHLAHLVQPMMQEAADHALGTLRHARKAQPWRRPEALRHVHARGRCQHGLRRRLSAVLPGALRNRYFE